MKLENEFTKDDVTNIQRKKMSIESERLNLVYEKKDLEVVMLSLKNKVRTSGLMPTHQYRDLVKKQELTRKKIISVEKEIRLKKEEITLLNIKESEVRNLIKPDTDFADLINTIQFLKNKYTDFSMDKTRIPAMRKMTEEFSIELQEVINYIKTL